MSTTVNGTCHCGAIRIELPSAPETVTDCNCSICRRTGVLWAYYSPAAVQVHAPAHAEDTYCWGDKSLDFCRCRVCGCITRWVSREGLDRTGINARLLPPDVLAAARVRKLDGADTWRFLDEP